ncbi:MAG: hypothetical protein ACJ76V_00325 [Thermoleophilaceae bacterium]
MNANLAEILTRSAERRPDTIAVKLDDFEANYALLDNASARIAGMLSQSSSSSLPSTTLPHTQLICFTGSS